MARKQPRTDRKEAKKKATLCGRGLGWLVLDRAARRLVIAIAVFLKRDFPFDIIRKGVRFDEIASRQIFVTLRQVPMRYLCKFAPVFDDVSV